MLLCFCLLKPCGFESITAPSILLYAPLETREYSGLAELTRSHTDAFALLKGGIHPGTFGGITLQVANLYRLQLVGFHYTSPYLEEVYGLQH